MLKVGELIIDSTPSALPKDLASAVLPTPRVPEHKINSPPEKVETKSFAITSNSLTLFTYTTFLFINLISLAPSTISVLDRLLIIL